uniref:Uncharacterized protein n=1 Tax=Hordeum vulgare subsp. vulgare TaxID=112509 RepID=A0A8I7B9Z4_HORVV
MDVAMGAMDSLLPKLGELLVEEYMLQARVKKDVQRLRTELTVMYAALREVRDAPRDQLDGQAKLCADRVRDLSGSLCKAVACGKGNCTVTEVCRKDSRYVALNKLMRAITVDTQAVQRHMVSILECVKDADASIRKRALELVYLLVNDTNVKLLTKELVDYLQVADPDFKEDLTAKICSIDEKFSQEKLLYLDQMFKVLSLLGVTLYCLFSS